MKKILGRLFVVVPAIALQVFWYCILLGLLDELLHNQLWRILDALISVLAILLVVGLVSKRGESSYKILWVILIVSMPILGALLYFMLGNKNTGRKLEKKLAQAAADLSKPSCAAQPIDLCDSDRGDIRIGQTINRLAESTKFPVTENETAKYYPFGEDMFRDMCSDLKNAQKYVYIEYFIIQSGIFWDTLVEILAERARAGVDIRVIYDDLGSIGTYSVTNIATLSRKGIKCIPFNPFLFIKPQLNNRDHRKIMVIDGEIAYSGGINLADEYINEVHKYGRWKDIGFRITGQGVGSYAYMFAAFWNAFSRDKIPADVTLMQKQEREKVTSNNGYILSYYDSPAGTEHYTNELLTEMLGVATDYIWFYTPYLMLGDTLFDAFIRAAKRGVDVRIIMPGIPDKRMIYRISRSYYRDLLLAGVKIYEYKPGFVHGKGFVADDVIAGIGTVNLDYRSLFLHYECNSVFYKADIVESVKQDYVDSLQMCDRRTLADLNNGVVYRLVDSFLRVFAPLL